jgi:hypothetical protein
MPAMPTSLSKVIGCHMNRLLAMFNQADLSLPELSAAGAGSAG